MDKAYADSMTQQDRLAEIERLAKVISSGEVYFKVLNTPRDKRTDEEQRGFLRFSLAKRMDDFSVDPLGKVHVSAEDYMKQVRDDMELLKRTVLRERTRVRMSEIVAERQAKEAQPGYLLGRYEQAKETLWQLENLDNPVEGVTLDKTIGVLRGIVQRGKKEFDE